MKLVAEGGREILGMSMEAARERETSNDMSMKLVRAGERETSATMGVEFDSAGEREASDTSMKFVAAAEGEVSRRPFVVLLAAKGRDGWGVDVELRCLEG